MRTNVKCNNSHVICTSLGGILLSPEPNIPEGPAFEKYRHHTNFCCLIHRFQKCALLNKKKSMKHAIGQGFYVILCTQRIAFDNSRIKMFIHNLSFMLNVT